MGLKEPYMEHVETGGNDISIVTDADESFVITGVQVETGVQNERVELKVGRSTMGYRYIGLPTTNHLFMDMVQTKHKGFEQILKDAGIDTRLPISSGEAFTLSGVPSSKLSRIQYEIYDAEDITKTMVNGTEADVYYVVNYGVIKAGELETGTYNLLTKSLQPPEIPAFPFGGSVPAKTEIDIVGLFGIPCVKPNGTRDAQDYVVRTTRLKLVAGRKTLLTKQEDGFMFEKATGDVDEYTYGYTNSSIGYGVENKLDMPFIFPTPLVFRTGEELGIYVKYVEETATTTGLTKEENERIGVIERIRKV